jgi:hypothetical protein
LNYEDLLRRYHARQAENAPLIAKAAATRNEAINRYISAQVPVVPYLIRVIPGVVTAVDLDAKGDPTGYCTVDIGGGNLVHSVDCSEGSPPIGQRYGVRRDTHGRHWIKRWPASGGMYIYWINLRFGSGGVDRLWRVRWPLEESPVMEHVAEWPRVGVVFRDLAGVDGLGNVVLVSNAPSSSARWVDVAPKLGQEPLVRHTDWPVTPPEPNGFAPYDHSMQFYAMAVGGLRSGVLVTRRFEPASFGLGDGNVSAWPAQTVIYRSDNFGETWSEILRYVTQNVDFTPVEGLPGTFYNTLTMYEREARYHFANLLEPDGRLVCLIPVIDDQGWFVSTDPSVDSPEKISNFRAYYIGPTSGEATWVTGIASASDAFPDQLAYVSGSDGTQWTVIRYRERIPMTTTLFGTLLSRHVSGPAGSAANLTLTTATQIFNPIAQSADASQILASIYTDSGSFVRFVVSTDAGATWSGLTDLQTNILQGSPPDPPDDGIVGVMADPFMDGGISAYIVPST